MRKKFLEVVIIFALFIIFVFSFLKDYFKVAGEFWNGPHMNSDNLIVGKVWADELGIDTKKSNLGRINGALGDWKNWANKEKWFRNDEQYHSGIHETKNKFSIYYNEITEDLFLVGNSVVFSNGDRSRITAVEKETIDDLEFLNVTLSDGIKIKKEHGSITEWKVLDKEGVEREIITYEPYYSQWGGEGWFLSEAYDILDIRNSDEPDSLYAIRKIVAIITAAMCVWVCYEVYKKYGILFALIWAGTFLLSPWIVSFSRQAGMIVCTCLLPIAVGIMTSRNQKYFYYYLPIVFIAVLIKCLCGYEYISTLMIISVSFLFADFVAEKQKAEKKKRFQQICLLSFVELGAFVTAFLVHASIRADSILEGVRETFTQDVLRRTIINNPDAFHEVYRESLECSVFEVINLYYTWRVPIFKGFEDDRLASSFFLWITLLPLVIFLVQFYKKKIDMRIVVLYILTYLGPISWFVLAKGYSFVHTHFTFLLWYYGYIQICMYIIIKFMVDIIKQRKKGKEKI